MSFFQAQQFFEAALNEVNPEHDPAKWNTLNGFVKLSQAATHLQSSVTSLERKIDAMERDVRSIKSATR
jgi:hypothetical protein